MADLFEISKFLDDLLDISHFIDDSQNGLQVESPRHKINKIAVAVDSGLSIIDQAIKLKAQLLIVHHGFFWNKPQNISGMLAKKVTKLIQNGCSLYAAHLPLDSHIKYGNAAELANFLKLTQVKEFCEYRGKSVGVSARCKHPQSLQKIIDECKKIPSSIEPLVLPFGRKDITNIGIVTGSGSFALQECADRGLDLLISGESKQEVYHLAKELKINAIFAGHYATETFGVKALAKVLEKKFQIKSIFIDEPTGI